jgi:nitroreductase/dihydropteridine reductase
VSASFLEPLQWRSATKSFDPARSVSQEDLRDLLEVLRLAPSSFGLQAWKFLVVESASVKEALLPISFNQKQVIESSHVIVLCRQSIVNESYIDRYLERIASTRQKPLEVLNGFKSIILDFIHRKTEEQHQAWLKNQLYIALGFLLYAAAQKGIDACPMEGFSAEACDQLLNLSALGLNSVLLCPIGYRVEGTEPEKVRFDLDELTLVI